MDFTPQTHKISEFDEISYVLSGAELWDPHSKQ